MRFSYLNINCIFPDFITTLRVIFLCLAVRFRTCDKAGLLSRSRVISSLEVVMENR